ncbi:MAG TPA: cyclophilin-like fold protein [Chthoniobacterales bacterium]
MNYRATILGILVIALTSLIPSKGVAQNDNKNTAENQMKVQIGSKTFTATLYDNATATAFKAMLPLTLDMSDVNRNEKYFKFSKNLPTNDSNPGAIHTGDLMIWSSRGLVLFYKSFSTSSSYTKIGRINDPSGLADAVGSGNVTVRFELK